MMNNFIKAVRNLMVAAQTGTDSSIYSAVEACEDQIKQAEMLRTQHGISISFGPLRGTGCYQLMIQFTDGNGLRGASVAISDENLRMANNKRLVMASYLEQLAAQLRG